MQCDLCFGGLRVSAGDMEGGINETGGGDGGEGGRRGEPRGNLFKGAWQGDERPGAAVAA